MSANLAVALELAAAGIPIFPAHISRNTTTCGLDKVPAISGWRTNASTDKNQIAAWWQQFPDAVPAIELGRAGLLVVDLDRHPGGPDGVTAFKELRNGRDLSPQPITQTPANGFHLIFRQPEGEPLGNGKGYLPGGCDVRGAGGWIVAPGAICEHGKWQPVKNRPSLADAYRTRSIPELPGWLRDVIRPSRPSPPPPSTTAKQQRPRRDGEPREVAWATAALEALECDLANAPPGTRNECLNKAAHRLGTMVARNWLERAHVEARLLAACRGNGLVHDDGEKSTLATLASGLSAGMAAPHADLPAPVDKKVAELAVLSRLEYDRRRKDEAKNLGIKLTTLDREVAAARAQAEEDDAALPHWHVEPWPEAVDGAVLLADVERTFTRYVYLPTGASVALALWTLHAWTMDAGDISPFIVLVSPTKRCGKTTVLIILYYLTPKSELASNISPSALFRYVENIRPTLLIDEADSFMKDNEELRGILNSGHTKAAAHVIRNVEINGEHKPRRFSTWAPKAIATIRELADTLEDRAIVLALQRKPRGAKVDRLRKRDNDDFAGLRRKAARWAADNFAKLTDPDPRIPDALNDRAADNWRPLLAIADLAGEDWPRRAREAACILSGDGHDSNAINVELLGDIEAAFGELDAITSVDLVAALVADPERPWATWTKGDKPLTPNQLARLLRPFAIISETVHPVGRPHAKGYRRARFEDAWASYLGQNPSPHPTGAFKACCRASADETGTTRNFQSVQEEPPHGSKNANLSYSHAGLHVRTFQNAESGDEGDSARANTRLDTINGHPARVPSDYDAVLEELAELAERDT
jgi:hypothetical protein